MKDGKLLKMLKGIAGTEVVREKETKGTIVIDRIGLTIMAIIIIISLIPLVLRIFGLLLLLFQKQIGEENEYIWKFF